MTSYVTKRCDLLSGKLHVIRKDVERFLCLFGEVVLFAYNLTTRSVF